MIKSKYDLLITNLNKHKSISPAELSIISKKIEKNEKESIILYLTQKNILKEIDLYHSVSESYGTPFINLDYLKVDETLSTLLEKDFLKKNNILPIFKENSKLYIATIDPTNIDILADIKFKTGFSCEFIVTTYSQLINLTNKYFGDIDEKIESEMSDLELDVVGDDEVVDEDEFDEESDEPIIKYVNMILYESVRRKASDIHLEHYEGVCRIRFRIDGMLQEIYTPPVNISSRIVSRMKILAKLDISERRLPQDGRIKVSLHGKKIEFRMNTLPTVWGEKIVLRLMDTTMAALGVDYLGFNDLQKRAFLRALQKPQGMILVTGPTGSGKTVTLYTGLSIINQISKNISTAEDPVEMNVKGINQVSVNPKVGLTFAEAMKAFLRQDPDVIMVGEIRDLETAEISIKAAQTGHLVLSTLHTNSAMETISRIKQMGIPVYNLATSLSLVIAQRLTRRLCDHCKEEHRPEKDVLKELKIDEQFLKQNPIYKANPDGCSECTSGYRGRVAVYEVLDVNHELSEGILENLNVIELNAIAKEQGFKTLVESGVDKVMEGVTSIDEIYRVLF